MPALRHAGQRMILEDARRLILKHGYLRRQGELEDAEATILGK